METWDVYNINRCLTDKKVQRGDELGVMDFHLVVHVCIFNEQGEMLIQQRQPCKTFPNMWDVTVGGAAHTGETSRAAAERESREEIGFDLDLCDDRPFFTINFSGGFNDFYLVERDIDIEKLTLQPEEVQAVKWASQDAIKQMVSDGEFIDYYFIDMLFEMRHHRGSMRPSMADKE